MKSRVVYYSAEALCQPGEGMAWRTKVIQIQGEISPGIVPGDPLTCQIPATLILTLTPSLLGPPPSCAQQHGDPTHPLEKKKKFISRVITRDSKPPSLRILGRRKK